MKMSLGNFIAQLRKEKGLTQKQLSEILGVSDKTVSHWEREESAPDISILSILAETLGVSVDELLKGEINPPINSVPQFVSTPKADKSANGYRIFKISNIITAALSVLALILGVAIKYLFNHLIYSGSANYFAFFVTLGGVFVSTVLTVIFNIIFTTKLSPESSTYSRYRFSANRISTLNFYLGLICLSVTLSVAGRYSFLFVLIALALCLALEFTLKNTSFMSTEKAFETKREESIYFLRRSCALLCTALILIGGSVHFFFSEMWTQSPTHTVINSVEEFKEYMETPKEMPEDAWKIDGVKLTTLPPTAPSSDVPTSQSPVVSVAPSQNSRYVYTETVYDDMGREVVTFAFNNKEVYEYSYHSEQGDFYITTYDSMKRAEIINNFCNNTLYLLMPFYYIAVVILSIIRYKKKSAKT